MRLTNEAEIALQTLTANGFKAYLVGGVVRDFVMNEFFKDIDITTDATPKQVEKCFEKFNVIETGIKHGTVTVVINKEQIEITTFRKDGTYSDMRRPDNVTFTKSLKEDLSRRDFTMNAIAYNGKRFFDYFNGRDDISKRIIRCVGDAKKRFNEDALRILRALRFSSVLGFSIEEKTRNAIFELKDNLKCLSIERIASELDNLIFGEFASKVIEEYFDVICVVLPELKQMYGFEQFSKYHKFDVLKHTLVALDFCKHNNKSIVYDKDLCWVVLLHDIGKINTFVMDENGCGHFYGHQLKSKEIAEKVLLKLKFETKRIKRILTLIEFHDEKISCEKRKIKKFIYKLKSIDVIKDLIKIKRADKAGQSELGQTESVSYDEIERVIREIEKENLSFSLKDLNINGNDLIHLGFSGEKIGDVLNKLLNMVLNEQVPNEKNKLLKLAEKM